MRYVIGILLCTMTVTAVAAEPSSLYDEIAEQDTQLFNAFNECDLEAMSGFFSEDLEFYHDLGGVTGYAQTMGNTKNNCERELGLKRTLVSGSLEVHPIKDFGAIQIGQHTFCHLENGKNDCGTFKFVHVWKHSDDGWRISRVISYDH